MSKKLAGTLFVFNGDLYDYNYMESIQCLLEFCDYVIVSAGGIDGTLIKVSSIQSNKLKVIEITNQQWEEQQGREKLSYFTNICIEEAERLGYGYQFNLQADEILHEKSYLEVRKAINDWHEGFMCQRINLWQDAYHKLVVEQNRMPCSTAIIRLTKSCYRSYDDAESIAVSVADSYYWNGIVIWHYGFIRKKEIMKPKIINMQVGVFQMADYDNKLKGMEIFDPKIWFDGEDLAIIDYPHPKIMNEWIKIRP